MIGQLTIIIGDYDVIDGARIKPHEEPTEIYFRGRFANMEIDHNPQDMSLIDRIITHVVCAKDNHFSDKTKVINNFSVTIPPHKQLFINVRSLSDGFESWDVRITTEKAPKEKALTSSLEASYCDPQEPVFEVFNMAPVRPRAIFSVCYNANDGKRNGATVERYVYHRRSIVTVEAKSESVFKHVATVPVDIPQIVPLGVVGRYVPQRITRMEDTVQQISIKDINDRHVRDIDECRVPEFLNKRI